MYFNEIRLDYAFITSLMRLFKSIFKNLRKIEQIHLNYEKLLEISNFKFKDFTTEFTEMVNI